MTVHSLRLIDRWLGIPLCLLLTIVRRMTDPFRPRSVLPPRRIVIVKLAEQGSTVLAHCAFRKVLEKVGRENVYFLVFEENRFMMDVVGLTPLDNVITKRTYSAFARSGVRSVPCGD